MLVSSLAHALEERNDALSWLTLLLLLLLGLDSRIAVGKREMFEAGGGEAALRHFGTLCVLLLFVASPPFSRPHPPCSGWRTLAWMSSSLQTTFMTMQRFALAIEP